MEREQEKEMDTRDRVKEKEELEELRNKILSEGHDNPDAAFQKVGEGEGKGRAGLGRIGDRNGKEELRWAEEGRKKEGEGKVGVG